MRRRRRFLIWLTVLIVPLAAAGAYYLIPIRAKVSHPIAEVRDSLKDLYPQYDFKTVTGNGTYVHGDTRKIQVHPAYEGWGEPGWDLDVEYRDGDSGVFEVEIANFAKLQSRRTIIRAEALSDSETRISITSNQHEGLSNLDFRNPFFARARLTEIQRQLEQAPP
jgi:hypothetical protein